MLPQKLVLSAKRRIKNPLFALILAAGCAIGGCQEASEAPPPKDIEQIKQEHQAIENREIQENRGVQ